MFCHCNGPWYIEVRKRLGYGAQATNLVVLMLACLQDCLNFHFFSVRKLSHKPSKGGDQESAQRVCCAAWTFGEWVCKSCQFQPCDDHCPVWNPLPPSCRCLAVHVHSNLDCVKPPPPPPNQRLPQLSESVDGEG